jgi:hypothetical protein
VNHVEVLLSFHLLHLDGKDILKLFLFGIKFLILFFSMFLKISPCLSELLFFIFIFFFHVSFIFGKLLGDISQIGGLFLSDNDVLSSLDLKFLLSSGNLLLSTLLGNESLRLGTVLLLLCLLGFSSSLDLRFQKKLTILNGLLLPSDSSLVLSNGFVFKSSLGLEISNSALHFFHVALGGDVVRSQSFELLSFGLE